MESGAAAARASNPAVDEFDAMEARRFKEEVQGLKGAREVEEEEEEEDIGPVPLAAPIDYADDSKVSTAVGLVWMTPH